MMDTAYQKVNGVRRLPPLILHPFSDTGSPSKLVQSSRASLMLQGLLANEEYSREELERMILEGRMCEVRMLYYVGKDVLRWIDQCVEALEREDGRCMPPQSVAMLLIDDAPARIREKLANWGVQDYRAIFSRAVGLNSVFASAPESEQLTLLFIRNYHQFADQLFLCWRDSVEWTRLSSDDFPFELYASGEYSRMLEEQWAASEPERG